MTPEQLEKRLRRVEKRVCAQRRYQTFADDAAAYVGLLCAGDTYAQPDGTLHVVLATTTTTTTTTSTTTTTTGIA